MRISLTDSAINDLQEIQNYYDQEGLPAIGKRLIQTLITQIETLSDFPEIGRITPEFAETKIRELIRPPYRIVYLLDAEAVHIIRIWRSERLLQLPPLAIN